MSLPQHKKSAEEIAKLRESLGITGHDRDDPPPPAGPPPAAVAPAVPAPSAAPAIPPERREPRPPAHPDPVLAVEISGPPPHHEHPPEEPAAPPARAPKQVRSLRKSEQGPLPKPHEPPSGSRLPVHRHSEREIKVIRRQEALAPHAHIPHPQTLIARFYLFLPGYLLALAGAVLCFYYGQALIYPAVCEVLALIIAAFIVFKKPLSRHHGAFIAVLALLVIVFGALHYFPNLKYGT